MAGLSRTPGGDPKRPGDEPPEKGASSADSAQREGLLLRQAQRVVVPRARIRQIAFHKTRVPPFLVGVGDVV
ncbi:MAG: hypothetical protein OSB39_10760, partial [Opitutales bacterium]|nr:hypothetical protein [Opitutales bacterium]